MTRHLVAVAKAVRELGIRRSQLQQLIHDGELHTFEGKIDLNELREHFPAMALDDDAMLERVQMIRGTAFARRVRAEVMPDADELSIQLKKRMTELSVEREKAKKYRGLLEELMRELNALKQDCDPSQHELLCQLNRWLLERLEN